MAGCTKTDFAGFDLLHGPRVGSLAVSWYGVANPVALSASFGTISVQLVLGVAGGVGGAGLPAAVAAASCILALRRSVPVGSVCADTMDDKRDMPSNTAVQPAALQLQDLS